MPNPARIRDDAGIEQRMREKHGVQPIERGPEYLERKRAERAERTAYMALMPVRHRVLQVPVVSDVAERIERMIHAGEISASDVDAALGELADAKGDYRKWVNGR